MLQKLIKADQTSYTKFHETDDGFVLEDYTDLTPVVEAAKREAIEGSANRIKGPEHGIHAATIPMELFVGWGTKKGIPTHLLFKEDKHIFSFLKEHPVFDLTKGQAQRFFNGI